MTEQYDLEDQLEEEQFKIEESEGPSNEVRQYLKEQKLYERQRKKEEKKHKATFSRKDNLNGYLCDHCGKHYPEDEGTLMYSKDGEFAYCKECLKILYPNYKFIKLSTSIRKLDYRSNHYDTKYFFKA